MLKKKGVFAKIVCCLVFTFCTISSISAKAALAGSTRPDAKTLLEKGQKLNRRMVADSAFLAFSEAVILYKDKSPYNYMMARIGMAEALLQMKATFTCYQQLLEDEAYIKKNVKPGTDVYRRFYRLKGEVHFSNREVENALAAWYTAKNLTIKKYGKYSLETARAYADLGKCYFAGGRTDSSFLYATQALQILRRQPEPLKADGAPLIYSLYGSHFRSMQYGSYDVDRQQVMHNGKKYATYTHVNLAYQDSAMASAVKMYGPENLYQAKVYTSISMAYAELYQFSKDIEYRKRIALTKMVPNLEKGYRIYEKYNSLDVAFLSVNLASVYDQDIILDKIRSEKYYLRALKTCLPDYKGTNLYQVPVISNIQAENHLGLILEYICYSFLDRYKKSKDLKDLEMFNQYAQKSLELVEYIRNKKAIYANETGSPSILFQGWNYGLSLESAFLLYQKTGNEKYKQQAYRNLEKFKNMNLLQAALENQLASTLKDHKKLNADYKHITAKTLRNEEQVEIARRFDCLRNQAPFKEAKTRLGQSRKEMQYLTSETRTKFPEFFNAKINRDYTLDIEEAQSKLSDSKTAVLSYFLHTNYALNREAYIMVVQKDRTDFLRVDLPMNYEGKIDSLVQGITTSNLPVYRKLASEFHDLLIKPTDKVLGKQIKKLMIMPDGYLWQIPFETLLTKQVAVSDYRKLPYLLNKYHISYQHSATLNTLGTEQAALQQFTKPILAMAPFADKSLAGRIASGKINLMSGDMNAGTYAKLPYTINLLQKLEQKIKGLFLIDKEATEDNFKNNAGDFSIIHLATHAETDMANPLNSKFLMAKSNEDDGELHMSELLNLNIKPNLAVLSACETGKGMIDTKSEGMTSLSWCFYYLGCPSTLSTLWKVDDRQTSNVLEGFYSYLFEGKTKQEALQQAKLDFISKARTSDEANPFYWSGLVLTGDAGTLPVNLKPWWQQTWFIVSLIVLVALAAWVFRKKQATARTFERKLV